jgi:hypothetical protein
MIRPEYVQSLSLALVLVVAIAACDGKSLQNKSADAAVPPAKTSSRYAACTLMPKEEVSEIIGEEYTKTESDDDGRSPSSSCHYATETNPAGMTIGLQWINPDDYSDPAEHAALQKASIGGAKLANNLVGGMAPGGIAGMPSGPVADVGDEAMQSMTLLTARKGDYTVMVQIVPTNMMALLTDSTVARGLLEKEKTIARKTLAKL